MATAARMLLTSAEQALSDVLELAAAGDLPPNALRNLAALCDGVRAAAAGGVALVADDDDDDEDLAETDTEPAPPPARRPRAAAEPVGGTVTPIRFPAPPPRPPRAAAAAGSRSWGPGRPCSAST